MSAADTPLSFAYPQHLRLKTSAQFKAVHDRKKSVSDAVLVLYAKENGLPHARLGLAVSKKVGNAVVRNRYKRLFREAFRLLRHELPSGLDYVLIPRTRPAPPTLDEAKASLRNLTADAARRLSRSPPPLPKPEAAP